MRLSDKYFCLYRYAGLEPPFYETNQSSKYEQVSKKFHLSSFRIPKIRSPRTAMVLLFRFLR